MASFFYCGRLSSAQLVPLQAPKHRWLSARARSNRRHSGEASKTMDYKSVFTNLCLELQQNRSWIKGLGKNPFTHSFHSIHSFPDGSAFCPGAPKRVPSDSEKHRRVYTSSNVCHSHEWRVDTTSGMTLKKQNACLHAVRHAVETKIACIHGLRSEGVKTQLGRNPISPATLAANWTPLP